MENTVFREARPLQNPSLDISKKSDVTDNKSYAINKETDIDETFNNSLEAWELEKHKKYVNEYFDTHNIYKDFSVKMQVSMIDKFVREQMSENDKENTIPNYKEALNKIEKEIGSDKLELFERFKKINGYIKVMKKLRDAKKKLGDYKNNVSL